MQRRQFVSGLGATATLGALSPSLRAQSSQSAWPKQAVRLVVPFAPGGTSDVIARLISKPLGDILNASVVVENKPGAAGALGAVTVAQSTDQHTVLISDLGTVAILPAFNKDVQYKLSDLKGVTMLAYSPHILAVHPSVPANNLRELVEFSKKTRLNVASAGSGSPNHLGVVDIAMLTGMKWQHVPYKGGAQAIADTAAGHTHMLLNGMLATWPLVQNGRLKAIGVSKRTRMALIGQVPTIAEQGAKDFESGTYQGIVAPTSMPKDVVAKLNAAFIQVIRMPDVRAKLAAAGAEVSTTTPTELDTFLVSEGKRWTSVMQRAGANLEGAA